MRGLTAVLWALLALLLVLGGSEFLFACGLRIGPRLWSYCRTPIDRSASLIEAERGERLQRLIHVAEMRLAEKQPCEPAQTKKAETDPTMRRGYERGAKHRMIEVFLAWNTYDDLDLVVFCPGGGVLGGRHDAPRSCGGGAIDLDANRALTANVTSTPTEHAVWGGSIPEGEYRIGAYLYKATDAGRRRSIPFKMIFKFGDEKRTCDGQVQYFPESDRRMTRDGMPMIARDLYIDWSAGADLPQCDLRVHEDAYCQNSGCQSR